MVNAGNAEVRILSNRRDIQSSLENGWFWFQNGRRFQYFSTSSDYIMGAMNEFLVNCCIGGFLICFHSIRYKNGRTIFPANKNFSKIEM